MYDKIPYKVQVVLDFTIQGSLMEEMAPKCLQYLESVIHEYSEFKTGW